LQQRDLDPEIVTLGCTWIELMLTSQNRTPCRTYIEGLICCQ